MNMTALIIQLIAGAIGGNAAGGVAKDTNLGPVLNTILGAVGGGVGGQILNSVLGLGACCGGHRHRLDRLGLRDGRRQRRPDGAGDRLLKSKMAA